MLNGAATTEPASTMLPDAPASMLPLTAKSSSIPQPDRLSPPVCQSPQLDGPERVVCKCKGPPTEPAVLCEDTRPPASPASQKRVSLGVTGEEQERT